MGWNYGDIYEAVAQEMDEDAPALIHEGVAITWREMDRRSNNLGRALLERGVACGDKVAFYMRNHSAYMEALAATFKARFVHVNVNYRYVEDELWYILDNSDAKVVIFAGEFGPQVQALKERLPLAEWWIQVDDGSPRVEFALAYEDLVAEGDGAPLGNERAPEDMFFIYTGGTTGMPKGVMWEQQEHFNSGGRNNLPDAPQTVTELAERVRLMGAGRRTFPVCPLMHGTGLFTAMGSLAAGGCIVTVDSTTFDPARVWQTVEEHQVNSLVIVGDAFASPLLQVLDENPGKYDISSLAVIISSGVMWSPENKQGLLKHQPEMMLIDSFGSSEAVGFGTAITTKESDARVAKFAISERTKVFTLDHKEVLPGSGEVGFVAKTGGIPSGYYKDPEKSAATFPTIEGVRYSIPGDWCQVEEDGTLTLLGRGSVCINTAGEKVYPEEVEEVIKTHPDVVDALVVGVPDPKWGQSVTAVVEMKAGCGLDEVQLKAHVRKSLSGYKCPKHLLPIDSIGRAANGKADYKRMTEFARSTLGID